MSDITDLEKRINSALDRIAQGIEARGAAAASETAGATENLLEELEIERATNERLIAGREKYAGQIERLETRLTRLTERLNDIDVENKRLQNVVEALRSNNEALRAANAEHRDGSDVAVKSLEAEVADIRAARAADLAEIDDVLSELQPLLKEA